MCQPLIADPTASARADSSQERRVPVSAGGLSFKPLSFPGFNPQSKVVQSYLRIGPLFYSFNPEVSKIRTRSPGRVVLHVSPSVFIQNYVFSPVFLQTSPWRVIFNAETPLSPILSVISPFKLRFERFLRSRFCLNMNSSLS